MRRLLAVAMFLGGAAQAETHVLPSGLSVDLLDRIVETQSSGEIWLTLRYVTPQIGTDAGEFGYDAVSADIDRLCDTDGLAAAAELGGADQVVITLMDRAVERGVHDPEATMYIGAYLPTEGGCVWQ